LSTNGKNDVTGQIPAFLIDKAAERALNIDKIILEKQNPEFKQNKGS
jgi:hypothetical protein